MVLFYLFCFGDINGLFFFFFFSSRRRHTRLTCDWSQTCALPICLQARNPGIRRQKGHLTGGFPERWRRVLFDRGKKSPKVGKKHGEVERTPELGARRAARFCSAGFRDFGTKFFLKGGDVLVELEKFSGEIELRSKTLGAPHSRVVLGPTGLCCRHLRGVDESPTISLYQPG